MAKKFFRFLRGELNGFYITNINNTLNVAVAYIESFLTSFKKMQFNIDTMPEETIYNIGTFAGVYLVRLSAGEAYGAMRMTESYEVNGNERSERGLLKRSNERFDFVHTEQEEYASDINTLADDDNRSSLVGNETVQGYISSNNLDVIDEDGNVKPSAILSEPPSGEAYSEFYGNKFMFLSEQTAITHNINASLFIELYKVMQYIRYNGANIDSLTKMFSILCPNGLATILYIGTIGWYGYFELHYTIDTSVEVDYIQQRLNTLEYLVHIKFPQFNLILS